VASAETLAYAVATGVVGDPRSFKRPVRVTVPRALPTDDVLILRDKKGEQVAAKKAPLLPTALPWKVATTLDIHEGLPAGGGGPGAHKLSTATGRARLATPTPAPAASAAIPASSPGAVEESSGIALVLSTLDEVRSAVQNATEMPTLRAVLAPFIPSNAVAALASEGIAAFSIDAAGLAAIKGEKILALPAPAKWADVVPATAGKAKVDLTWLAIGSERGWTHAGTSRAPPKASAR
jgi:aconitate hydratase